MGDFVGMLRDKAEYMNERWEDLNDPQRLIEVEGLSLLCKSAHNASLSVKALIGILQEHFTEDMRSEVTRILDMRDENNV